MNGQWLGAHCASGAPSQLALRCAASLLSRRGLSPPRLRGGGHVVSRHVRKLRPRAVYTALQNTEGVQQQGARPASCSCRRSWSRSSRIRSSHSADTSILSPLLRGGAAPLLSALRGPVRSGGWCSAG